MILLQLNFHSGLANSHDVRSSTCRECARHADSGRLGRAHHGGECTGLGGHRGRLSDVYAGLALDIDRLLTTLLLLKNNRGASDARGLLKQKILASVFKKKCEVRISAVTKRNF